MARSIFFAIAAAAALTLAVAANGAADKIVWKPLNQAIISVDGKAPPFWNVYTGDKQNQILLVQLWKRYLLVAMKEGAVYDVDPKTLVKKGDGFEFPLSATPENPLSLAEWSTKSMGLTLRLRFRLKPDGRLIELMLPQKPDLRPFY